MTFYELLHMSCSSHESRNSPPNSIATYRGFPAELGCSRALPESPEKLRLNRIMMLSSNGSGVVVKAFTWLYDHKLKIFLSFKITCSIYCCSDVVNQPN